MTKIILRIVILAFGITVAAYLIPGVEVASVSAAIKAAIVLGLLNVFIKPLFIILTLPITLITLGLFTFVINGLILWLVSAMVGGFQLSGFFAAVFASVIISVMSMLLNQVFWD